MIYEKIIKAFNRDYPDPYISEDEKDSLFKDWLIDKILEIYENNDVEDVFR